MSGRSVTDVCRQLLTEPDHPLFTYSKGPHGVISRQDFLALCQSVSSAVAAESLPGDRVIVIVDDLLCSQTAIVGSILAGRIAVPVSPELARSVRNRPPRLNEIISSAEPSVIVTSGSVADFVLPSGPRVVDNTRLAPAEPAPGSWWNADVDTIALIQYTSGSTSHPRGVCVSHRNVDANHQLATQWMNIAPGCRIVSWLPLYHDMGLAAGVLHPLFSGIPGSVLQPKTFIQNPVAWLQAISDSAENVIAGAPDFGYRWAWQRVKDHHMIDLDLDRWKVAFCGAERVQAKTVRNFAARFASCGFDSDSLLPCYGLAEATLFVSGTEFGQGATISAFSRRGLERGELTTPYSPSDSVEMVACGVDRPDIDVVIADDDDESVGDGRIGEIRVRHASVAAKYWRSPVASAEAFDRLVDNRPGFLTTGDLGAIVDGRLYVVGRLKDCFIHNGINYWPDDIEAVARSAAEIGPLNLVVAAGIDEFLLAPTTNEDEVATTGVIIGIEVKKADSADRVCTTVRQAVYQELGLNSLAVVAVKRGTIPRTTSGKPQRRRWVREMLAGEVPILAQVPSRGINHDTEGDRTELAQWVCAELAALLDLADDDIDENDAMVDLGADSVVVIALASAIHNSHRVELTPEAIAEAGTPRALAKLMAANRSATGTGPAAARLVQGPTPQSI